MTGDGGSRRLLHILALVIAIHYAICTHNSDERHDDQFDEERYYHQRHNSASDEHYLTPKKITKSSSSVQKDNDCTGLSAGTVVHTSRCSPVFIICESYGKLRRVSCPDRLIFDSLARRCKPISRVRECKEDRVHYPTRPSNTTTSTTTTTTATTTHHRVKTTHFPYYTPSNDRNQPIESDESFENCIGCRKTNTSRKYGSKRKSHSSESNSIEHDSREYSNKHRKYSDRSSSHGHKHSANRTEHQSSSSSEEREHKHNANSTEHESSSSHHHRSSSDEKPTQCINCKHKSSKSNNNRNHRYRNNSTELDDDDGHNTTTKHMPSCVVCYRLHRSKNKKNDDDRERSRQCRQCHRERRNQYGYLFYRRHSNDHQQQSSPYDYKQVNNYRSAAKSHKNTRKISSSAENESHRSVSPSYHVRKASSAEPIDFNELHLRPSTVHRKKSRKQAYSTSAHQRKHITSSYSQEIAPPLHRSIKNDHGRHYRRPQMSIVSPLPSAVVAKKKQHKEPTWYGLQSHQRHQNQYRPRYLSSSELNELAKTDTDDDDVSHRRQLAAPISYQPYSSLHTPLDYHYIPLKSQPRLHPVHRTYAANTKHFENTDDQAETGQAAFTNLKHTLNYEPHIQADTTEQKNEKDETLYPKYPYDDKSTTIAPTEESQHEAGITESSDIDESDQVTETIQSTTTESPLEEYEGTYRHDESEEEEEVTTTDENDDDEYTKSKEVMTTKQHMESAETHQDDDMEAKLAASNTNKRFREYFSATSDTEAPDVVTMSSLIANDDDNRTNLYSPEIVKQFLSNATVDETDYNDFEMLKHSKSRHTTITTTNDDDDKKRIDARNEHDTASSTSVTTEFPNQSVPPPSEYIPPDYVDPQHVTTDKDSNKHDDQSALEVIKNWTATFNNWTATHHNWTANLKTKAVKSLIGVDLLSPSTTTTNQTTTLGDLLQQKPTKSDTTKKLQKESIILGSPTYHLSKPKNGDEFLKASNFGDNEALPTVVPPDEDVSVNLSDTGSREKSLTRRRQPIYPPLTMPSPPSTNHHYRRVQEALSSAVHHEPTDTNSRYFPAFKLSHFPRNPSEPPHKGIKLSSQQNSKEQETDAANGDATADHAQLNVPNYPIAGTKSHINKSPASFDELKKKIQSSGVDDRHLLDFEYTTTQPTEESSEEQDHHNIFEKKPSSILFPVEPLHESEKSKDNRHKEADSKKSNKKDQSLSDFLYPNDSKKHHQSKSNSKKHHESKSNKKSEKKPNKNEDTKENEKKQKKPVTGDKELVRYLQPDSESDLMNMGMKQMRKEVDEIIKNTLRKSVKPADNDKKHHRNETKVIVNPKADKHLLQYLHPDVEEKKPNKEKKKEKVDVKEKDKKSNEVDEKKKSAVKNDHRDLTDYLIPHDDKEKDAKKKNSKTKEPHKVSRCKNKSDCKKKNSKKRCDRKSSKCASSGGKKKSVKKIIIKQGSNGSNKKLNLKGIAKIYQKLHQLHDKKEHHKQPQRVVIVEKHEHDRHDHEEERYENDDDHHREEGHYGRIEPEQRQYRERERERYDRNDEEINRLRGGYGRVEEREGPDDDLDLAHGEGDDNDLFPNIKNNTYASETQPKVLNISSSSTINKTSTSSAIIAEEEGSGEHNLSSIIALEIGSGEIPKAPMSIEKVELADLDNLLDITTTTAAKSTKSTTTTTTAPKSTKGTTTTTTTTATTTTPTTTAIPIVTEKFDWNDIGQEGNKEQFEQMKPDTEVTTTSKTTTTNDTIAIGSFIVAKPSDVANDDIENSDELNSEVIFPRLKVTTAAITTSAITTTTTTTPSMATITITPMSADHTVTLWSQKLASPKFRSIFEAIEKKPPSRHLRNHPNRPLRRRKFRDWDDGGR